MLAAMLYDVTPFGFVQIYRHFLCTYCFPLQCSHVQNPEIPTTRSYYQMSLFTPLTPNDLQRRCEVSPLKIKITSKNMFENPTNTPIIYSVYYVW
jgi:hypothetical protein